jgi:hypothetical protein
MNLTLHGLAVRTKVNCSLPFSVIMLFCKHLQLLSYNVYYFKDYHMIAMNVVTLFYPIMCPLNLTKI